MPRYQITSPEGRVVVVEGDTPPTDADADEIFAGLSPSPAAAAPAPAPAALDNSQPGQPAPSGGGGIFSRMRDMLPAIGGGGAFTLPVGTTMDQLKNEIAPAGLDMMDPVVEGSLRIVPPVVAGVVTAPAQLAPGPGTAANLGAIGLGAGIGDNLAQGYRRMRGQQESYNPGATIAAGVTGAIPFVGPSGVAPGLASGLAAGAKTVGAMGATGMAGKTIETLIDEQRLPTPTESVVSAAVPAAFGVGMGATGVLAENVTSLASRLRARQALFTEAGVTPTPGMINPPALARGEAVRAAGNSPDAQALAGRVENAYGQLGAGVSRMAGNTAEGAKLLEDIRPLVTGVRDAEQTVAKLSQAAQAAEARAAAATQKFQQARDAGVAEALDAAKVEYATAADEAFQRKFADALSNARDITAAKIAPEGAGRLDPSTARDLFGEHVIKPLEEAFQQQSQRLYGAVDSKVARFQTAPVLKGLDDIAREVTGGAPSRVREALDTIRQSFTDAEGNVIPAVSLDQLRNVRAEVSRRLRYGQSLGNNEERLLKGVAAEITSQIDQQAASALGDEGAKALLQANRFYATTRGLFDERGVDVFLRGDPSDSYVRTLVDGMAKSGIHSDEFRNVQRVISAVEQFSPEIGNAARTQMRDTVRKAILFEAGALDPVSGSVRVDTGQLASMLGKFAKVPGTLEALGLGDPKLVAQLQTLTKKYPDAGKLTSDEWSELFSVPAFSEAVSNGRFSTAIEPFLAARSVDNRLRIAANLERAGRPYLAKRAMETAMDTARAAGQNLATARARYQEILNDPVMVAFNNPKLSPENFNTFAKNLFDPGQNALHNDQIAGIVSALRSSKNPANQALLERLRERYIAERIVDFVRAPAKGEATHRINVERLREFFNPAKAENVTEVGRARILLSSEQFKRLREFTNVAEELSKYQGFAGSGTASSPMMRSPRGTIVSVSGAPGQVSAAPDGRGGAATVTKGIWDGIMRFASARKYNLMAHAIYDPQFMTKAAGRADTVAGFVNAVGPQRAILLVSQNPELARELDPKPGIESMPETQRFAAEFIMKQAAAKPARR